MITLSIICLTLGLTTLNAKTLPHDVLLYDVLVKYCPILNVTDPSFKNQEIFQKCKNWQDISETKTLTEETKNNVLCLLYYDSLAPLCAEIKTSKISNVSINLVPDLKDYKIDKVCKGLALPPAGRKFEHNLDKIFNDEGICYKLCLNFDGSLVKECGLAYYFSSYNISQPTQAIVPIAQQLETNPVQDKSQSAVNAVPAPASIDVPEAQQPSGVEENSEKTNQAPSTEGKSEISQQSAADRGILKLNSVPTPNNTSPNKNISSTEGKQSVVAIPDEKTPKSSLPKSETDDKPQTKDQALETLKKSTPEPSQIHSVHTENYSEQNLQDISMVNGNKGDTGLDDLQSSLDQPGQMMEDDTPLDDDDGTDGNYKDLEEKQAKENVAVGAETKNEKPNKLTVAGEMPANYNTAEDLDGESYFFSYFMVICVLFVLGYVGYHNRQKVMALMLEGKRGKRQTRGRRPNSANYHKLDSNLEEAISSACTKNSSHVIY